MFFTSLFSSFKSNSDRKLLRYIRDYFEFTPLKMQSFRQALVHKSVTKTKDEGIRVSNERMEFLGDAILDAIVGDYLYRRFPDKDEGFLTKARSRLVSRSHLIHLAQSTGLDNLMVSDVKDRNIRLGLAGNAMEAMIGAVYLQKGYRFCRQKTMKLIERFTDVDRFIVTTEDYKSLIYHWVQTKRKEIRFEARPLDEKSLFEVTLYINNKPLTKARAKNKKAAENEACRKAVAMLNIK